MFWVFSPGEAMPSKMPPPEADAGPAPSRRGSGGVMAGPAAAYLAPSPGCPGPACPLGAGPTPAGPRSRSDLLTACQRTPASDTAPSRPRTPRAPATPCTPACPGRSRRPPRGSVFLSWAPVGPPARGSGGPRWRGTLHPRCMAAGEPQARKPGAQTHPLRPPESPAWGRQVPDGNVLPRGAEQKPERALRRRLGKLLKAIVVEH